MHDGETHARLMALLAVVKPTVAERGGRIVKNTGDGFFKRVVENCGIKTECTNEPFRIFDRDPAV